MPWYYEHCPVHTHPHSAAFTTECSENMLWVSSGKKTPPSAYKIIIIQFSISCLTDLTVKQEKLFLFSYILPKKSNRTQLGSGKDENTAFHSRFGYTKHVKMDYLVFKTYFLSRYANPVGNMSSRIPAISLVKICKSGWEYVISHSSHISHQDMQIWCGSTLPFRRELRRSFFAAAIAPSPLPVRRSL